MMRSFSSMYTQVNRQSTSLNKRFLTLSAFKRSLISMDALVSSEIRSSTKGLESIICQECHDLYLCTAVPITRERANVVLIIWVLQIDEFKNVHSIMNR